jgi:glycosyltransferase involved in cell wall biosynthesis
MFEQAGRGAGFAAVETTDWGLLFVPWVVEHSVPVVLQMHGSCGQIDLHDPVAGEELQGHLIRLIERGGVAHADVVQTYSSANAAFWQSQSGKPVDFVPPAFAVPVTDAIGPRNGRGLVVGRVQRWKGPQVLCEALALLGVAAPRIDWIGRDTVYGARSQSTAQLLARRFPEVWGTRVAPRPPESPSAIGVRQREAEFVVVPSTWDVFNFTCVEAMAAGTPVVCSDGAGASQWIEDGVNGFLFESENARSLAGALRRLMALDGAQRRAIGQRGRETVRAALDPEAIAERRAHVYATVRASASAIGRTDWLRRAVGPADEQLDGRRLLDHLPLRSLSLYVLRRAAQRVLSS